MTTLAQAFGFTRDQAQAITEQAFNLLDAGDLDGAATVFTGLLALNPLDAGIHAALGSVFHQQGRTAEAIASYDEALELDGDTVLARVNRGELRCQAGQLEGIDDLRVAAGKPSAVQARAQRLLQRYLR
jgi:Flp pilus assembly protein TadD